MMPVAAAAQPPGVVDPIEAQRGEVRAVVAPECPGAIGDEIVVCGRREEEEARRFRVEPSSDYSGPPDRAGGEQRDAMGANLTPCSTTGRYQRCGGGLDLFTVGAALIRGYRAIRARRD